jgi:hypothetical protein
MIGFIQHLGPIFYRFDAVLSFVFSNGGVELGNWASYDFCIGPV